MRVALALDVGEKRIGLAWGDDQVKLASPYGIVEMGENVVAEIANIAEKLKAEVLVLGLPRNSKGEETQQSLYVRDFAKKLEVLGLPIVFQDESLTSVEAEKNAQSSKNYQAGQPIDDIAASLILSDYLEKQNA